MLKNSQRHSGSVEMISFYLINSLRVYTQVHEFLIRYALASKINN